jgi:hypothetical protein
MEERKTGRKEGKRERRKEGKERHIQIIWIHIFSEISFMDNK